MSLLDQRDEYEHAVSVVVPVYRGEQTLQRLVEELSPLTTGCMTAAGRSFRVAEVILVHDAGPDNSDVVIRKLAAANQWVRPVWLSRNFGQHAATIAGMSSTGSEWIATLDEDGQFDPKDIGSLLDVAMERRAQLVYANATNAPPHGFVRNMGSSLTKSFATRLLAGNLERFSSFRLMLGDVGRGVTAFIGPGVYLDVALSWAFGRTAVCPVTFRQQLDRPSGYSYRKLLSHFWQLVITAGTRPLRLVSLAGVLAAFAGLVVAVVLLVGKLLGDITVPGWTSLAVIVLLLGGANLFALGVVAEYVGAAVGMAMGKPLYLITSDPSTSPLDRDDRSEIGPSAVD
jgi:undecaprenyl-phosphate 4-deoxy-4-formamido-L-arabinose transferase